MTATILMGLVYATSASTALEVELLELDRVRAAAAAEAGTDIMLQELMDEPVPTSNRTGNGVVFGDAEWDYGIEVLGGNKYRVTVVGRFGDSQVQRLALVGVNTSNLDGQHTFYVGGDVLGADDSDFVWTRTLHHEGSSALDTSNGDVVQGTHVEFEVDDGGNFDWSLRYTALTQLLLTSGVHTGKLEFSYLNEVVLVDNLTLEGEVFAHGDLVIDGGGHDVIIRGPLMARRSLEFRNIGTLYIAGSIFAREAVTFGHIDNLKARGSLYAGMDVNFGDPESADGGIVRGRWEYDPTVSQHVPPEVSGGPTRHELTVYWRR